MDRRFVRCALAAVVGMVATVVPLQAAGAAPAPIANDDAFQTADGFLYDLGSILLNDVPATPGAKLTAELVQGPSHGTLTWDFNEFGGSFGYQATFGFEGDDTFTYRVRDPNGEVSTPATITVTVGFPGQTDPRSPTSIRFEGPKGLALNPLGFNISGNVYDAAGKQLIGLITFVSGNTVLCSARAIGGLFQRLPYATCVVPLLNALPLLLGGPVTARYGGDWMNRPATAVGKLPLL